MQIYHNKTLLIFLFHHQRIMWTLKQMQSINEDDPKLKKIHNTTTKREKKTWASTSVHWQILSRSYSVILIKLFQKASVRLLYLLFSLILGIEVLNSQEESWSTSSDLVDSFGRLTWSRWIQKTVWILCWLPWSRRIQKTVGKTVIV